MAKRKVFEGLNVKAYNFPSIGFEQFRVQSQSLDNLNSRINNVLKFAVGKVEEQSKIDAYEYAASNPLTISEYLNADPNERNKLLPKGNNVFNNTLRNAQINFLATDVQIAAGKAITKLEEKATLNEMSTDEFEQELNSIVNGYTQSFLEIDAEGAVTVKAKLATMAHTSLNSYSATNLKKLKAIKDATITEYATNTVNNIAKTMMAYGSEIKIYDDTDPDNPVLERTIDIDEHFKKEKDRIAVELLVKGYKKIDEWSAAWDKEVIKQKVNYLTTYYDKPGEEISASEAVELAKGAKTGLFNGNKDYQKIYNSLPEKEQIAFRKQVRDFRDNIITDIEKEEKAKEVDYGTIIQNQKIAYYEAKLDNDYATAKKIVEEIGKYSGKVKEELLIDLEKEETSGGFTDPKMFLALEEDLVAGRLTDAAITAAWDARKITWKQKSEFTLAKEKRQTATFKAADSMLKKMVGYEDTRIITTDKTNVAFEKYRKASVELYDYYRANPGIASNDLIAYAKTLIQDDSIVKERTVQIQTKSKEIFNVVNTNEVLKVARLINEEKYGSVRNIFEFKKQFSGSEGFKELKILLENIQSIPVNGELVLKDNLVFKDVKVTRPKGMNDDELDILITKVDDIISLLEEDGR